MNKHNATIYALILALTTTLAPTIIHPTAATPEPFSIIWITDTQYLAESNLQLNNNLTHWIANNAALYNTKMVIHTGDLVNDEGNQTQWQNANQSMSILFDNGIPYCWCAGNHDFNTTLYLGNQYAAFNPQVLVSKQYWVSSEYDGMNTAVFFNASGWECLVVNISFDANDTVLGWANNLLEAYPDAHAIMATHAYLDKQCGYSDWAADFQAKVLNTHSNVFLTLSGHYYPTSGCRVTVEGRDELLFNQQDACGKLGAASARILTFNPENGTISVQTFSVCLGGFVEDSDNCFTLYTSFRSGGVGGDDFLVCIGVVVLVVVFGVSVAFVVWRFRRRGVF